MAQPLGDLDQLPLGNGQIRHAGIHINGQPQIPDQSGSTFDQLAFGNKPEMRGFAGRQNVFGNGQRVAQAEFLKHDGQPMSSGLLRRARRIGFFHPAQSSLRSRVARRRGFSSGWICLPRFHQATYEHDRYEPSDPCVSGPRPGQKSFSRHAKTARRCRGNPSFREPSVKGKGSAPFLSDRYGADGEESFIYRCKRPVRSAVPQEPLRRSSRQSRYPRPLCPSDPGTAGSHPP